MADYKARKEAFVSNLSGGTITDINLVTLVAPVSPPEHAFLLINWMMLTNSTPRQRSFFGPPSNALALSSAPTHQLPTSLISY